MGISCYVARTHLHNTIFLFSFIYDFGKPPPIHFRLRSSIINTHIHKYTHTSMLSEGVKHSSGNQHSSNKLLICSTLAARPSHYVAY